MSRFSQLTSTRKNPMLVAAREELLKTLQEGGH